MVKRFIFATCGILLLTACASTQPVSGALYADVKGPVAATSNPRGSLSGEACATSYLGLVALGDASITTAAKNGGIATISHVEQQSSNILGIIHKYCTVVWGFKGVSKAATAKGMGPGSSTSSSESSGNSNM